MMRRNLYLAFALLFVGIVQASAQQLIVQTNNGVETKFEELDYALCKITFENGSMHFHVGGTVKNTMAIKDIQRISFYGLQGSGIEMVPNADSITYSSATESLAVNVQPGVIVMVYRIDGTHVLSHVQTIASSSVSVEHLPAGAYIVVAGSETLKFVK